MYKTIVLQCALGQQEKKQNKKNSPQSFRKFCLQSEIHLRHFQSFHPKLTQKFQNFDSEGILKLARHYIR